MKNITLHPLQGIEIAQIGTLHFGQNQQDVIALLGEPSSGETEQLYYDDWGLRIDLDHAGNVEFMEFWRPENNDCPLSLYGIDPLATPAAQLTALLAQQDPTGIDDGEAPCCYAYTHLSIGVWRAFAEEDVLASIAQMRENGEDTDADWVQQDLHKSRYFWTIGIGKPDYYQAA